MKMLIAAAALATLIASPAFAQSYDPDIGTGNIAPAGWNDTDSYASSAWNDARDLPYAAYNAVTPFDTPIVVPSSGKARAAAIRECSARAAQYKEYTYGDMEFQQYRACMAADGQVE